MNNVIAYIFYFIASSIPVLWRKNLMNKKVTTPLGQVNFAFKNMLIIASIGLLLPLFSPFFITGNHLHLILLSIVSGVAGMGYWVLSLISIRHIEAGDTNLLINIYTPVTIFLAFMFLDEKLTMMQLLGTSILLFSMFIISGKYRKGIFKFNKHFLLMIASGIMLGFVLVAERALQKMTGFSAGTIFSWWSQVLFLSIVVFFTKSKNEYSKKEIISSGLISSLGSLSYVILVTIVGNLSLVSAMTTFKVVIVFILAAIFLRERDELPRKIIGSAVAVIGLFLMK